MESLISITIKIPVGSNCLPFCLLFRVPYRLKILRKGWASCQAARLQPAKVVCGSVDSVQQSSANSVFLSTTTML